MCYYPSCAVNVAGEKTGHCSENYFRSAGGREPTAIHAGNCVVPPQCTLKVIYALLLSALLANIIHTTVSPKCYWPYCDHTGHCDGNKFTGIAPSKVRRSVCNIRFVYFLIVLGS